MLKSLAISTCLEDPEKAEDTEWGGSTGFSFLQHSYTWMGRAA